MEKDELDVELALREEEECRADKQGGMISLLMAMNENMKAMGESLKRLLEGPNRPNFGHAEPAKKPKRCSEATASTLRASDPTPDSRVDSDSEQLLDRPNTDEKEKNVADDTLLDEVSRHLEGEANKNIWTKLGREVKSRDLTYSQPQQALATVGKAIAQSTIMLLEAREKNVQPAISSQLNANYQSEDHLT
eukprot:gene6749-7507_t